MGWIVLAVLGGLAFAGLWRLGVPRTLWSFAGAALMLGATGYALQGRPEVPGRPTRAQTVRIAVDPQVNLLRQTFFGRFTSAELYWVGGDGLIRSGATGTAVKLLLGGVGSHRTSPGLWTALGQAYVANDGMTVSPPARFAFDQAMRLAPEHPGPPFFLGLAYVREGKFADARRWWRRALSLCPPGSRLQREVGGRLLLLEAAMQRLDAAPPAAR